MAIRSALIRKQSNFILFPFFIFFCSLSGTTQV
nr:MAG TPA: hypothetical protein [Caudoviricetes sp.]